MQVRFWFDPVCPWCWITSFWLEEVAPHRDLQIDWRSISLKVRNEVHDLDPTYAAHLDRPATRTFQLLRVVEALRDAGHTDLVRPVYVEFGRHFHHGDDGMTFDVAAAVTRAGADPVFADAVDDDRWDEAVRASTKQAEAIAGNDVGTPVIAYEVDGTWKGYFGPVLPSVPRGDDALRLWDGVSALIRTDGFYELKRTRDVRPDLASTGLS